MKRKSISPARLCGETSVAVAGRAINSPLDCEERGGEILLQHLLEGKGHMNEYI